jgi:hypothetical protein
MGVMTEIYHEKVFCSSKSFIFDNANLKEVFVKKCSIIIANVTNNKNFTLLIMNTIEEKYRLTSCL